jgi:purine-binding chemotaxis protein CheW
MSMESINDGAQYLTFQLSQEVFAVEVTKVREILEYVDITKIPRTPDFMRGVINVRGSVVPVMDLRMKFGTELTDRSVNTCIIVLELNVEGETIIIGALADAVQEVVDLGPAEIEPPPKMGLQLRTEFLKGIGKRDHLFIMILDIDRVFSSEDLEEAGDPALITRLEEAV